MLRPSLSKWDLRKAGERRKLVSKRVGKSPWVNILPKNPYLAKRGFLENLILLKSKKDDFRENLPNC